MYLKDLIKQIADQDSIWVILNDLDEDNGIFNTLVLNLKEKLKLKDIHDIAVVCFANSSLMVRLNYSNGYNDFTEITFNDKGYVINRYYDYGIDKPEFEMLCKAVKIINEFWDS